MINKIGQILLIDSTYADVYSTLAMYKLIIFYATGAYSTDEPKESKQILMNALNKKMKL